MQAALSATVLTKQSLNAQTQPSPGFPANKTISNLIFPTENEFSQPLNNKNIKTHATNQGDLTKAYSASSPFSQSLPYQPFEQSGPSGRYLAKQPADKVALRKPGALQPPITALQPNPITEPSGNIVANVVLWLCGLNTAIAALETNKQPRQAAVEKPSIRAPRAVIGWANACSRVPDRLLHGGQH